MRFFNKLTALTFFFGFSFVTSERGNFKKGKLERGGDIINKKVSIKKYLKPYTDRSSKLICTFVYSRPFILDCRAVSHVNDASVYTMIICRQDPVAEPKNPAKVLKAFMSGLN